MLGACTNGWAFTFSFTLTAVTLLPSNPVSLNDTDGATHCSSSTHCTSSACHTSSTAQSSSLCHATASAFHCMHVRCTSSIFVVMWPMIYGSTPWSHSFWRLCSNILYIPVSLSPIQITSLYTKDLSHHIIHIVFSSSKLLLSSGIAMPSVNTTLATVLRSFTIRAFLALALVG